MPWNLLKYGLSRKHHGPAHFPPEPELKSAYDVVIIGAGGHGLAAAYYLARDWGIRNIAVLTKRAIWVAATRRATPPSFGPTI